MTETPLPAPTPITKYTVMIHQRGDHDILANVTGSGIEQSCMWFLAEDGIISYYPLHVITKITMTPTIGATDANPTNPDAG
jgi:hypothetical protein